MSTDIIARGLAAGALGAANAPAMVFSIPSSNPETALEAACTAVGAGGRIVFKRGSVLYLSRSVLIPANISIDFNNVRIRPAAGANIANFYGGFCFLVNCDASGNQILAYGGDISVLQNIQFYNEPYQGGVQLAGLRGVLTKGRTSLVNVNSQGMWQTYSKPTGYSGEYVDQLEVKNITIGDHNSSDWALDLGGLGDNIIVDNVGMWLDQTNRNLVRLANCRGGRISRVLGGGNVLVQASSAVTITESHIEQGYIQTEGSAVAIKDSQIWKNPNFQPIAPIVLKNTSAILPGGPCKISCVDIYSTFTGTGDWRPSAFGSETSDAAIDDGVFCTIENFNRSYGGGSSASKSPALVGTSSTPTSGWANRRHMMMSGAAVRGGSAVQSAIFPRQRVNNSVSQSAHATLGDTPWKLASGTYYYRIQVLFGNIANLVGQRLAEFSAALTQGSSGALIMSGLALGYAPCFLRIFRGTATGTYTHYVDTAVVAGQPIDTGYYLATGEAWQAVGGLTAAFANGNFISVGFQDDDPGAKTIAYATAAPSTGNWTIGDRVFNSSPAVGQPKAWTCTAAGFPGTWTSEGNL